MTKLTRNTGISVAGSLNALQEGEAVMFPKSIIETTIRQTAVRLKNTKGKTFKVNRQMNGSHIVTRVY